MPATPTIYIYKTLAEGQLPSSKGALYTAPALTSAAVKSISFNNTGAGNNTVTLYLKPGSTSRRIFSVALATNETIVVEDFGTLEAGQLIEGSATNAAQVDYVVTGAEGS